MVLVAGNWQPFKRVHGIEELWKYVRALFEQHQDWLEKTTPMPRQFDPSVEKQVLIVESGDPRSTFFRYPTTDNIGADAAKSSMQEHSFEALAALKDKSAGEMVFAMIVEDSEKAFVTSYVHDDTVGKELAATLKGLAAALHEMHAAMRMTLTDGW